MSSTSFRVWGKCSDDGYAYNVHVREDEIVDGEIKIDSLREIIPLKMMLPTGTYGILRSLYQKCPSDDADRTWTHRALIEGRAYSPPKPPEESTLTQRIASISQIIEGVAKCVVNARTSGLGSESELHG
jgi:hypothetical protein